MKINQFKGTRKLNQHLYSGGKAPIKIKFCLFTEIYFTFTIGLLSMSKYISKLRSRYYQMGLQIIKKIWTYLDGSLLSADLTLNSHLFTADIEILYV